MKLWQYKAPLIVVGAGTLGLLLLCLVSAIALQSPQQPLQEKVNPSTLNYRDQDNLPTPDVRKEVGHPVEKLWLAWLNIEVDVPFLWGGHAWMRRSIRSGGSDLIGKE